MSSFVLIDKIWILMIVLVLFFTIPVVIFANQNDAEVNVYAADAVNEFVNKCSATGIITSSEYEKMINLLDGTGNIYDIYLIHSSKEVAPEINDDGQVMLDKYGEFYEEFRNEEIYNYLFPEDGTYGIKKYYMNEGDYIRVVVENKVPTLGRRLYGMLTLGVSDKKSILASRGDYVGHEVFDR